MRRLAAFAVAVLVAFAAALGVGRAVGPLDRSTSEPAAHGGDGATAPGRLRLAPEATTLAAGRAVPFAFRILDGERTVRAYDVLHARRLHLIVASRDLSEFHHLHPGLGSDGVWRTTLRLARPGGYVAFADFSTAGERSVLREDLFAPGPARPRPLPAERPEARVDGYRVVLGRHEDGMLQFGVTRNGAPVRLQPYLGALGHLVVLRAGDLEYLHAHPHGAGLAFGTEFPTAGTYRAFVQFRAAGAVHTASFTIELRA